MLGGYGDGAVGATYDGTFVVERIFAAKVDDETGVFGTARKSDGCAHFNAEGFVGLGARNARRGRGIGATAAPDVDGARRRSRTAGIRFRTNTGRIRIRTNIALNFLLGVLTGDETSQDKRQDHQTTKRC